MPPEPITKKPMSANAILMSSIAFCQCCGCPPEHPKPQLKPLLLLGFQGFCQPAQRQWKQDNWNYVAFYLRSQGELELWRTKKGPTNRPFEPKRTLLERHLFPEKEFLGTVPTELKMNL